VLVALTVLVVLLLDRLIGLELFVESEQRRRPA